MSTTANCYFRFNNGATKRAYYDYIRAYDWPTGRRLEDGTTEPHGVADDWTVPAGWDLSTGDWKEGFDPTAENATVGKCNFYTFNNVYTSHLHICKLCASMHTAC